MLPAFPSSPASCPAGSGWSASGLRLRAIATNVAKLLRPFEKSSLPAFPFFSRRRLITETIDFLACHLGCFGGNFFIVRPRWLCAREPQPYQPADGFRP